MLEMSNTFKVYSVGIPFLTVQKFHIAALTHHQFTQEYTQECTSSPSSGQDMEAIGWMEDIASALAFLHDRTSPVIHRVIVLPECLGDCTA